MDMTSTDFRQANLLIAIKQCGSMVALSEKVGLSPQYLSQLKNGSRGIGHKTARLLESKLGMKEGAFDLPPAGDVHALEATLAALSPELRYQIIADAIDELSEDGAKALAQRLLARLAQADA